MANRPDVSQTIELDRLNALHLADSAWACVTLRHGTMDGVLSMRRVSVTERFDFVGATLDGAVALHELESLGPFTLDESTVDGSFLLDRCVFRDDFTFERARIDGVVQIDDSTFARRARFLQATADATFSLNRVTLCAGASFSQGRYGLVQISHCVGTELDLSATTVSNGVLVENCRFSAGVNFDHGAYGPLELRGLAVGGPLGFEAVSASHVSISGTTFGDEVSFRRGRYDGAMYVGATTFERDVSFEEVDLAQGLMFDDVTFKGTVTFEQGTFRSPVLFRDTTFEGPVFFTDARFAGGVAFERTTFGDEARFAMSASRVQFVRATFSGAGNIMIADAQIELDECSFGGPTTLYAPWTDSGLVATELVSVRDTDLTNLTLAGVGLRHCMLSAAHNVDQLVIESPAVAFAAAPSGWKLSTRPPWVQHWTGRRVLLEEVLCRARRLPRPGRGWQAIVPADVGHVEVKPEEAARCYRELRKGLEDAKDEPGAADFYYGEMEMRRAAARGSERWLLTAYWLTSGYGLRAGRAIAALAALVAVATIFVALGGFAPPARPTGQIADTGARGPAAHWVTTEGKVTTSAPVVAPNTFRANLVPALTYSAESATVVFRGPDQRMPTLLGRWCQIVLRILGPVLLGLAVLSLRGRVKR
jgi:hypothetical protein